MDHLFTRRRFLGAAALSLPVLGAGQAFGQDAREALGTKLGKASAPKNRLSTIMA